MPFRFDKLTIKAQEAVAQSQELAAGAGNPQIEPVHLLAALLKEDGGIVRPVLEKIGAKFRSTGNDRRGRTEAFAAIQRRGAAKRRQSAFQSARRGPGRSRQHEGRLRIERASAARDHRHEVESARHTRTQCDRQEQSARRNAIGPRIAARDRPIARRQVSGTRKIWHRSRRACPARQARSGDRPRSGNTPRHSSSLAAHEKQPSAHRRTGRR